MLQRGTILSVSFSGMATDWVRGSAADDGSLDFGECELHPAQTARVILESTAPLPAQTYFASLHGPEIDGLHPFPPGGVLEFDTFSPGYQ